jgi:hypothetical protein
MMEALERLGESEGLLIVRKILCAIGYFTLTNVLLMRLQKAFVVIHG